MVEEPLRRLVVVTEVVGMVPLVAVTLLMGLPTAEVMVHHTEVEDMEEVVVIVMTLMVALLPDEMLLLPMVVVVTALQEVALLLLMIDVLLAMKDMNHVLVHLTTLTEEDQDHRINELVT